MNKEDLLGEVEDILRTMPERNQLHHDEDQNFEWLGRVAAFVSIWKPGHPGAQLALSKIHGSTTRNSWTGVKEIILLLHEARQELRMNTIGPVNEAIGKGQVFDYFDEIRKILETAQKDILFIDPFMDAEFVSRYLPHISKDVSIRILTRKGLPKLLPAIDLYTEQTSAIVQVRSIHEIHDRYFFIDESTCYQSGASFKDGARKAPTTLTQITDVFKVVNITYEKMWQDAKIER